MTKIETNTNTKTKSNTNKTESDRQRLLDRRSFFGGAFKAIGLVGAGTLFEQQAWAAALSFEPGEDITKGVLFDQHSMQMLLTLTDLVMPETDTPGGVELGVHQFLDHQLFTCYGEADQQRVQTLILRLDEQSDSAFNKQFLALSREESEVLLHSLEAKEQGFTEADKETFSFTKTLIVFGYFTSERGATEVLSYQAIPGGYVGSIPYSSVGTAWGSLDFY